MIKPLSTLALGLATASTSVAQSAGEFVQAGDTLVSAMMMFLGNEEKVYILDKVEGNSAQVDGHPAYGSVWDINGKTAEPMAVLTNSFCASGMHLPNGSYVTFGGNGAIGPGGNVGSQKNNYGGGAYDDSYQDYDGTKSIRVLNPCTSADDLTSSNCQWYDDPSVLSMQKHRWYSAAEPMADGTVAIIGGFVNGGYINRNYPNVDPATEGGAAEPTFEFYPSKGEAQTMQFMIDTSGLNAYAHTFLMSDGRMLVQANTSTMLWEPESNVEHRLPDMPNGVVRVYPASGATAMLPLTPANNYTQTVLFCGGSDMPDEAWGNYSWPMINTWEYPASKDCQRITPMVSEEYEADDDMLEGRTMGQFIALPDGTMLVVNGGLNGTAGYSTMTGQTPSYDQMPYGMSLASGPVGTPAIYNPNAPKGSRWSNAGFGTSNLARLYHSSAILLPDASVMIAGSNPNVDVNTSTVFPTQYTAEYFYPSYFTASTRPQPDGIPKTVSYGGDYFDVTIPASSYSGSANDAADNTSVVLIRPGWTTHGMNMGQRSLQLNNSYTVKDDGSITLHVSQAPPNANLFQPGPALMFVTVNGIPSNGTMVTVGNGQIGTQPTSDAASLPANVRVDSASGSASGSSTGKTNSASTHTGAIIGGIIAAIAVVGIIGALFGICMARKRRAARTSGNTLGGPSYAMSSTGAAAAMGHARTSDSSAFMPLKQDNSSMAWNQSHVDLSRGYRDDAASLSGGYPQSPTTAGYSGGGYGQQHSGEYDPYYDNRR